MTGRIIPEIPLPIKGDVSGIYVIRNNVSGRVYVGSSSRIKMRWNTHRYQLRLKKHHAHKLQLSWIKHGELAFSFFVIEVVEDHHKLYDREQHWIDLLQAAERHIGFNVHPTAGGPRGVKPSLETRAKISAARKGKNLGPKSEAHKAAISAAKIGVPQSLATRAKMSIAKKKKRGPMSDSHKAILSVAKMGKKRSLESRRKQSLSGRGKKRAPFTEAHRKAISAARIGVPSPLKGKPKSPEHAAKIQARLMIRNRSPEGRVASKRKRKVVNGQGTMF